MREACVCVFFLTTCVLRVMPSVPFLHESGPTSRARPEAPSRWCRSVTRGVNFYRYIVSIPCQGDNKCRLHPSAHMPAEGGVECVFCHQNPASTRTAEEDEASLRDFLVSGGGASAIVNLRYSVFEFHFFASTIVDDTIAFG